MLPRAGGWYGYSRRAFGEKAGFVVGCCDFTVSSVANATATVAFAEFAGELVPALAGIGNWQEPLDARNPELGGFENRQRAQEISSLVKAGGLVAIVIAALTIPLDAAAAAELSTNSSALVHSHSIFLGLMLALQGVIVTCDGWYAPIYFVEEDTNPATNLPRSMIGTALACIAIFLLVNAALCRVLRLDHFAGSPMPWSRPRPYFSEAMEDTSFL